jgi:cytochrome c553
MQKLGQRLSLVFGAVLAVMSGTLFASPTSETMRDLASDVESLMPYIYGYDKVLTSEERELISDRMSLMADHVERIGETVAPRAGTYQVSYQILGSQLAQAQRAFTDGRERYGLSLLRSAVSVCATCHTQDDRSAVWLSPDSAALDDPYIKGEFFFLTRQYDRAGEAYKVWLDQQEELDSDARTQTVFGRLLLTALRVEKSGADIEGTLTRYAEGEHIAAPLRTELYDWIAGVKALQSGVDLSLRPDKASLMDMASDWLGSVDEAPYGHLYLPDNQRPRVVWLRGELYRALLSETERTLIPRWLYWLALSDRLLEYRFYYSLADLYLQQCMLDYSKDPIARQCYQEYENYLLFFNSGSAGTFLPEESVRELKEFKVRVFGEE